MNRYELFFHRRQHSIYAAMMAELKAPSIPVVPSRWTVEQEVDGHEADAAMLAMLATEEAYLAEGSGLA